MGRKKKPHYRVVVADSAAPRDGRFVETIGYYKPLSNPARLVLDMERVDHWLSKGASPSATVKSLIAKARRGGDATVALGEEDVEARKTKRAEVLATRRAAEQKAAAEAKAVEDAAAAEEAAAQAEAADDGAAEEAEDAPEAKAEEAPEAEAEEAPKAEAEEAPEAEAEKADEKEEEKSE